MNRVLIKFKSKEVIIGCGFMTLEQCFVRGFSYLAMLAKLHLFT